MMHVEHPLSLSHFDIYTSHNRIWQDQIENHDQRLSRSGFSLGAKGRIRKNGTDSWEMCNYNHVLETGVKTRTNISLETSTKAHIYKRPAMKIKMISQLWNYHDTGL